MLSHDTFCNKHAHKKYDVWCTQPHLFYKMECYEIDLQILQDKNNAKHENEKFGSFFYTYKLLQYKKAFSTNTHDRNTTILYVQMATYGTQFCFRVAVFKDLSMLLLE